MIHGRPARLAFGALALVCALLGLFPYANAATGGAAVPWWDEAVRDWALRGSVAILAALALAAAAARAGFGPRFIPDGISRPSDRTFAAATAAFAFAAAALLARWSFAGQPFTSDEMAAQWHARILEAGRLYAVPEAHAEFFNTAPVLDTGGKWFSQYPVGGPLLLAIAGPAAWLLNPALLALATVALYSALRRQFDTVVARLAILLFVTSPMVLLMAASQMNHVPALAAAAVALAALARWDRASGRDGYAAGIAIGVAVGVLATIRPLDAAVVGVSVGGYQLWRLRSARERWPWLAAQVAAGAVPLALLLLANWRTTGSPLLFAYEALNGPEHALGFHRDPNGEVHTPARGVVFVSGYLMRLARYLFEWPLPGTLFLVVGLALHAPSRWSAVYGGLLLGILLAYGAYWFDGFFAGPRFLFTALPALVVFSALSFVHVAAALRRPLLASGVWLMLPVCVLWAWVGPGAPSSARERVASYREQRTKLKTDVEAQIERAGLRNALVLVNDGWRGRLQARLRVLGVSQFRAERLLNTVDACALQSALDDEDAGGSGTPAERRERAIQRAHAYGAARLEPGLPADRAIALVPGTRPTPACLSEFLSDSLDTMPFAMFLARQEVGPDGRVGGNVVFARDMGPRNELLRSRFGDRTWFVYRPARGLADTTSPFVPYTAPLAQRTLID